MLNQNPVGTPQKIEVCGVEMTEFRTLEQAIENFRLWVSIGMPDRAKYRLWNYIPLLKDWHWGTWDSVNCHEIELKLLLGGTDYRWAHLFPSADLRDVGARQAAQMFLDRLDATHWETGFFDWRGEPDRAWKLI